MIIPPSLQPKRVIVLRPRGLGDVVLSSAVVDALTRAYPKAEIDFMSEKPSRPLLESDTRLRRIFLFGKGRSEGNVRVGDLRDAVRWMLQPRADLFVDLFSNPRSALVTGLSGARYRVGLDRRIRRFVYNVRVPRFLGAPRDDGRWAGEVQVDMLRRAGVRWPGPAELSVALTAEDREFARTALESLGAVKPKTFAAVLPGGSWASKRWPAESFARLAGEFSRSTGAPVVVLWGPPEKDDAEIIAREGGSSVLLAPPSTIRGMAALLEASGVLLSTDCFGRHLAIALGRPTLGVFGSTRPSDWTPPTGDHRTVGGPGSPSGGELRNLTPEEVLDVAVDLWRSLSPNALRPALYGPSGRS